MKGSKKKKEDNNNNNNNNQKSHFTVIKMVLENLANVDPLNAEPADDEKSFFVQFNPVTQATEIIERAGIFDYNNNVTQIMTLEDKKRTSVQLITSHRGGYKIEPESAYTVKINFPTDVVPMLGSFRLYMKVKVVILQHSDRSKVEADPDLQAYGLAVVDGIPFIKSIKTRINGNDVFTDEQPINRNRVNYMKKLCETPAEDFGVLTNLKTNYNYSFTSCSEDKRQKRDRGLFVTSSGSQIATTSGAAFELCDKLSHNHTNFIEINLGDKFPWNTDSLIKVPVETVTLAIEFNKPKNYLEYDLTGPHTKDFAAGNYMDDVYLYLENYYYSCESILPNIMIQKEWQLSTNARKPMSFNTTIVEEYIHDAMIKKGAKFTHVEKPTTLFPQTIMFAFIHKEDYETTTAVKHFFVNPNINSIRPQNAAYSFNYMKDIRKSPYGDESHLQGWLTKTAQQAGLASNRYNRSEYLAHLQELSLYDLSKTNNAQIGINATDKPLVNVDEWENGRAVYVLHLARHNNPSNSVREELKKGQLEIFLDYSSEGAAMDCYMVIYTFTKATIEMTPKTCLFTTKFEPSNVAGFKRPLERNSNIEEGQDLDQGVTSRKRFN